MAVIGTSKSPTKRKFVGNSIPTNLRQIKCVVLVEVVTLNNQEDNQKNPGDHKRN